eukprot:6925447-Pyramimonas_sp.AAC.1
MPTGISLWPRGVRGGILEVKRLLPYMVHKGKNRDFQKGPFFGGARRLAQDSSANPSARPTFQLRGAARAMSG